jgi:hypothetical protein
MKRFAPRRRHAASATALLAGMLCWAPLACFAAEDKADLVQEVTLRCIYDMGEFGDEAVQACMRADMAAAEALTAYPAVAQPVVARCMKSTWTRGYGMVQVCVERDLAAAAALAGYGTQHAEAIRSCEERVGAQGAARVKNCVDAAQARGNGPQ